MNLLRRARLFAVLLGSFASTAFAQAPATGATPAPGRYQLVVVTGHVGSPFLLDTATGCVWHLVQNTETKRSTFVEVDVENLHWSWGSGAQQLLAARVDASNLTDDQKRALKLEVQKTGCGVSPVVLTPTMTETPRPATESPRTPEPARPQTPRP
jgi:hypothetical protein